MQAATRTVSRGRSLLRRQRPPDRPGEGQSIQGSVHAVCANRQMFLHPNHRGIVRRSKTPESELLEFRITWMPDSFHILLIDDNWRVFYSPDRLYCRVFLLIPTKPTLPPFRAAVNGTDPLERRALIGQNGVFQSLKPVCCSKLLYSRVYFAL